mmetsp:Transcript_58329/g.115619  ORF Transcript_58329/g.115619 Transcript_58329/m.115619 type:complete len:620 (-) Transcript_58329:205-2064(-)
MATTNRSSYRQIDSEDRGVASVGVATIGVASTRSDGIKSKLQGTASQDHFAWRQSNVPIFRACSPKIRNDDTGDFNGSCALILEVLGPDAKWNGRMHMSEDDHKDLLRMIEEHANFVSGTGESDGELSLEELIAFIDEEANRHTLLTDYPMSIACLASKDLVQETFVHVDKDNNNKIDLKEWSTFLHKLHNLHLTYLLVDAFRQFRAFFGRGRTYVDNLVKVPNGMSSSEADIKSLKEVLGMSDNTPVATEAEEVAHGAELGPPAGMRRSISDEYQYRSEKLSRFQVGLDREFRECWEDFWYYSANYHPLHGIFSAAPDSILSWRMRLALEIVTLTFSYFTFWLAEYNERRAFLNIFHEDPEHFANIIFFNTVVVTLPGMALWWTLFLLFNCPRLGVVDEALSKKEDIEQARRCRCLGIVLASLLIIFVVGGVVGVSFWRDLGWKSASLRVLRGRTRGYVISWFLQAFVYFNPLIAWGDTGETPTLFGTIGDLIGLGQWRIERQKFKLRCSKQLKAWEERQICEAELRRDGAWRKARKRPVWKVQREEGGEFTDYGQADGELLECKWRSWKESQEDDARALVKKFQRKYVIDLETMTQVSHYGKKNEKRLKIMRDVPLL